MNREQAPLLDLHPTPLVDQITSRSDRFGKCSPRNSVTGPLAIRVSYCGAVTPSSTQRHRTPPPRFSRSRGGAQLYGHNRLSIKTPSWRRLLHQGARARTICQACCSSPAALRRPIPTTTRAVQVTVFDLGGHSTIISTIRSLWSREAPAHPISLEQIETTGRGYPKE